MEQVPVVDLDLLRRTLLAAEKIVFSPLALKRHPNRGLIVLTHKNEDLDEIRNLLKDLREHLEKQE